MTKTSSIALAGGVAALALTALLCTYSADQRSSLAWEQPPILTPRPGSDIIIIKGQEGAAAKVLAWEQPPILTPRPGTDIIIIKGTESAVSFAA